MASPDDDYDLLSVPFPSLLRRRNPQMSVHPDRSELLPTYSGELESGIREG